MNISQKIRNLSSLTPAQIIFNLKSHLNQILQSNKQLQSQINQINSNNIQILQIRNQQIKQYIDELNLKYVFYQQQKIKITSSIQQQKQANLILKQKYQQINKKLQKAKKAVVRESVIKEDGKEIEEAIKKSKNQYSLGLKKLKFIQKQINQKKLKIQKQYKQQERLTKQVNKLGERIKQRMQYQQQSVIKEDINEKDDDVSTCKSLNLKTLSPF